MLCENGAFFLKNFVKKILLVSFSVAGITGNTFTYVHVLLSIPFICVCLCVMCRGEMSAAPPRILGRPLSVISDTDGMGEVYDNIKTRRFRPKARKMDVDLYIESCLTKFGCFVPGDQLTSEEYMWAVQGRPAN